MSGSIFVVDAMLGSLARKLRIFGFDTKYHKAGSDRELLDLARDEGRAIITSDRRLGEAALAKGLHVFVLIGGSDRARIRSLVEQARSLGIPLAPGEPLCAVCNGSLSEVKRTKLKGRLPPRLLARHRVYYVCNNCGKVYWHGSHWARLRRIGLLLAPAKRI